MALPKILYTESPRWHEKIGGVYALLERAKISGEQSGDLLRLRKLNRILSIHASTAIEGNRLTLAQVTDVINGKPVWGPPRDIKEVQNAWQAYNEMGNYDPWRVADLLNAHSFMTTELVGESGKFRTVGVSVVRGDGVVMHRGSPAAKVPALVEQLLRWGENSGAHPLIKSSAVHYMLEHIHPFRDGNGRMGRLWQTLILSAWNPLFTWMPIETIVHHNQARYYQALQDSHANGVDCRPFIDFMLDAIENSLYKFVDMATQTRLENEEQAENVTENVPVKDEDVTVNVTVNVPVKIPVNDLPTNQQKVFILVRADPKVTSQRMAQMLGVTERTIKRALKSLRETGAIRRVGSDKTGHWEIVRSRDA